MVLQLDMGHLTQNTALPWKSLHRSREEGDFPLERN